MNETRDIFQFQVLEILLCFKPHHLVDLIGTEPMVGGRREEFFISACVQQVKKSAAC